MKLLVIDVGGTYTKYALMNDCTNFLKQGSIVTPNTNQDEFIDMLSHIYYDIGSTIDGITLSLPGIINSEAGYCHTGGHLKYNEKTNVKQILEKKLSIPVEIENDGKCAALAEAKCGSLKDCRNGIVVLLGTGIGGGIIMDGKVYKGSHFSAGEFSFISVSGFEDQPGPNSWSKHNSVHKLIGLAATAKNMDTSKVNGEMVFKWAEEGDRQIIDIITNYAKITAMQLFNLQVIYDPDKFAIGGGISVQPLLIEKIREQLELIYIQFPYDIPKAVVVPCMHYNNSNLIGAYHNFMEIRHT